MTIQRYFSKERFENFKTDIRAGSNPLIPKINISGGELDFQIRPHDKFNLYYKGNSLAEVAVQKSGYSIKIHQKFEPQESAKRDSKGRFPEDRFKQSEKEKFYYSIIVPRNELLIFFQKKIIKSLSSNIKKVNYGEEITFEQSLMTDNLDNEDFIIIDRQIGGGGLPGRLDLLALRKIKRGIYRFVVLEVKLGINPDLKGEVVNQIDKYINAISDNIKNFKVCYEKNYQQKKEIGLFPDTFPSTIKIDKKVEGKIVVGLYSKIGAKYIAELTKKHPTWKLGKNIIQFKNELAD